MTSCTLNDNSFNFDKFDNDTELEIKSYIHDDSDCGEWGGHSELITLTKFRDEFRLNFKRDSSDCIRPRLKDQPRADSIVDKKFKIDTRKVELIMDYIEKLNNHRPSSNLYSNAQNYYKIKFRNQHKTIEITISDPDNSWTLYHGLKKDLFKQ